MEGHILHESHIAEDAPVFNALILLDSPPEVLGIVGGTIEVCIAAYLVVGHIKVEGARFLGAKVAVSQACLPGLVCLFGIGIPVFPEEAEFIHGDGQMGTPDAVETNGTLCLVTGKFDVGRIEGYGAEVITCLFDEGIIFRRIEAFILVAQETAIACKCMEGIFAVAQDSAFQPGIVHEAIIDGDGDAAQREVRIAGPGNISYLLFQHVLAGTIMVFIALVSYPEALALWGAGILRGSGQTAQVAAYSFLSITFLRPLMTAFLIYVLDMGLIGTWCALFIDQVIRASCAAFLVNRLSAKRGFLPEAG